MTNIHSINSQSETTNQAPTVSSLPYAKANMGTVLIFLPNGSSFDCGVTQEDYERRVFCAITKFDCGYSDAQGIVDAEILSMVKP